MLAKILPFLFLILLYGGILVLFIYLVVKRIEDKKKENFEKRDN